MTPTGSNKESMRDSVLEREEGERERVSRVRHTTRRNYQSTVFCFHKKGPKIFRPTFTQEVLPSGYLPPPLSLISSHSLFVCLSFLTYVLSLSTSFFSYAISLSSSLFSVSLNVLYLFSSMFPYFYHYYVLYMTNSLLFYTTHLFLLSPSIYFYGELHLN